MVKVRVAIIGVGNCASSFVQGLHFYRNAKESDRIPGLMHVNLGGYHIRDVEISAAIDIDRNKVGKDVAEAIYAWPNNTMVFAKVPRKGITVPARHDARRAGQVSIEDHPEGAGLDRSISSSCSRTPAPTWS
jgi:myo-inositol-1-phosphate synthase